MLLLYSFLISSGPVPEEFGLRGGGMVHMLIIVIVYIYVSNIKDKKDGS